MSASKFEVIAAGHLCLDIIPGFPGAGLGLADLLVPGKLVDISDAVLSTGGASSNVGLALHRMGFDAGIVGKVGDDIFGDAVVKLLRTNGERLVRDMIVSKGEGTSYSIVINPPGVDRMILHSPGTNDTFGEAEISDSILSSVRLLHFGYPPLMRRFHINRGDEIKKLFGRARRLGVTTSLDMARPDPDGLSGKIDWAELLANVLPEVDVFVPSVDETIFMLDPALFNTLLEKAGDANPAAVMDIETISETADRLLAMGAAVIGLKLGDQGFYLKTTPNPDRLAAMGRAAPADIDAWTGRELLAPCRRVKVAGTLGAGDCTIGGFLGALLRGLPPDAAAAMAVAAGGASVEVRDANTGVPSWDVLESRLTAGWAEAPCAVAPDAWRRTPAGNRCRSDYA